MDAAWILLVWLIAVAAVYFAVSYWSRMALMRRRLFEGGVRDEEKLEVESGERQNRLAHWLMLAGFRSRSAPSTFVLATVVAVAAGLILMLVLNASGAMRFLTGWVGVMPPALGALVGPIVAALPWTILLGLAVLPWAYVRSVRRDRVLELERSLPIALDLLATMSETGLGFDASLAKIVDGEKHGGVLHDELRIFQLETLTGIGRIECFRRLSRRCEVGSMSIFCSALVQAEQVGAGFSTVLRHQADDLRSRRRERAMIMAQALPVKLVFPLVICFLPGIFLTTLGPAFMQFFAMVEGVVQGY